VDGLFFGLVAYSQMQQSAINQRYGDKWADTRVVYSKALPRRAARSLGAMLGGVLAAVLLHILVQVANMVVRAW
jgi:hypothetical protein